MQFYYSGKISLMWGHFRNWCKEEVSTQIPKGAGRLIIYTAIIVLVSRAVIGGGKSKNWLSGALEIILADVIYTFSIFGTLFIGVWLGVYVYDKTETTWLSWVIGILFWILFGNLIISAAEELPGIGWRIRILQAD